MELSKLKTTGGFERQAEERQLPPPVILIPNQLFLHLYLPVKYWPRKIKIQEYSIVKFSSLQSSLQKSIYIYREYHWCCSTTLSSSPCVVFSRESERKRCLLQVGDPRDQEGLEALVAALLFFAVVFAGPCLHVSIFCAAAASQRAAVGLSLVGLLVGHMVGLLHFNELIWKGMFVYMML